MASFYGIYGKMNDEINEAVIYADLANCEPLKSIIAKELDKRNMTGDCPPDAAFTFDFEIADAVCKLIKSMMEFQGVDLKGEAI